MAKTTIWRSHVAARLIFETDELFLKKYIITAISGHVFSLNPFQQKICQLFDS